MKIKRYKHARRHLGFYKNVFNFRQPHLVLLDGTFTHMALRHQTNIKEQLPKYLDGEVQLLTTKCAIVETESLGKDLYGAGNILRRYKTLKCSHRDKPIGAAECIKSMLGGSNSHHYYIGTQDAELTEFVHSVPGTPLLYMNMNAIILEKPSHASLQYSQKILADKLTTAKHHQDTLKKLRGTENEVKIKGRKRRRPKEPNPLSVKKKKNSTPVMQDGVIRTGRRRKRRSKVAKDVSERATLSRQ